MMRKLDAGDPETESRDLVADNIEQLKSLFPEAFTEGKIDFDVLRQLLGGAVDEREEKYGLNWHGKRQARQIALTPSLGTLRPCPEESLNWDTTQNLMIEGDNLEVLKLLQKSYAGKVKLIYIDPPYNTGSDLVYHDTFGDGTRNYLEVSGQTEGARKIRTNTESSGRFHTDWLNMVYPRLQLARDLLRPDGVIFVSIDDVEVANLRLACDGVFGAENFVAELIWEGANKNDARQIGIVHEYVLVYARNRDAVSREWGIRKEGIEPVLEEVGRLKKKHGTDYAAASEELAGWFRAMKATPSFSHRRFRNIDGRGAYKEDDPTAPGGRRFELRDSRNGRTIPLRRNRGWGFDQAEFDRLVDEARISFVTDSSVMVRRYLHETDTLTPPSVFYQPARSASERLARLMGESVFGFPKDETVLAKFIEMATSADAPDIVVDFFAGSGTTGHAVMAQNASDGGRRRYLLVQLPEPLDDGVVAQKVAAKFCDDLAKPRTIAEITKERLRRTSAKIKSEAPAFSGDLGFRVFTLDSSNIRTWNPDPSKLDKTLLDSVEHLEPGRTETDILYELLLKRGLDLCAPIETRRIAKKEVHSVGGGVLIACLTERITRADVEPLAAGIADWHRTLAASAESPVIFRDSAFENDVAKANMAAILEQHGLSNILTL
jgi:adenine-specific DNA-methyltransferase